MKHLMVLTRNVPGEHEQFKALCGYVSAKKSEFVMELAKVTCQACKEQE